jgi:hypothetical protein
MITSSAASLEVKSKQRSATAAEFILARASDVDDRAHAGGVFNVDTHMHNYGDGVSAKVGELRKH